MRQPHNILKEQGITVAALIALVIAVFFLLGRQDAEMLRSVKSGQAVLECHFKDGWRVVSPERVKDYWDGRWYFDNGSATRCELN